MTNSDSFEKDDIEREEINSHRDIVINPEEISQEAIEQSKNEIEKLEKSDISLENRSYQISDNKKKLLDKVQDKIITQRENEIDQEQTREQENDDREM